MKRKDREMSEKLTTQTRKECNVHQIPDSKFKFQVPKTFIYTYYSKIFL